VRRSWGFVAGAVVALAVAACGSSGGSGTTDSSVTRSGRPGASQTGSAASGRFRVSVSTARFPRSQHVAQPTDLTIAVRNTGHRTLPDVAVTICERSCAPSDAPNRGTAAQAFGYDIDDAANTADPSRPLWIVDRGPGACHFQCNAPGGDVGASATASSNTWALGTLAPGATARFQWALTPIVPGRHIVAWEVAGDLSGRARAVSAGGEVPRGVFIVSITSTPAPERVTPSGKVVTTSTG
jgi:hypothetical protein